MDDRYRDVHLQQAIRGHISVNGNCATGPRPVGLRITERIFAEIALSTSRRSRFEVMFLKRRYRSVRNADPSTLLSARKIAPKLVSG